MMMLRPLRRAVMPFRVHGARFMSAGKFPDHQVLKMPALSPTMTEGAIAQWVVKEGGEVAPGTSICEIETDKATVDFEAQDEGYLAKILVQAGSGQIPVGAPIGVIVEEESNVAAFASFTIEDAGGSKTSEPPKKEEKKKEEPAPPAPAAPKKEQQPPPSPPPPSTTASNPPKTEAAAPVPPKPAAPATQTKPVYPAFQSPLKGLLEKSKIAFEKEYGQTGMVRVKE